MRRASEAGLYFIALMTALALPDMMGGLGAPNGKATGPRYRAWLAQHAGRDRDAAAVLWDLRCSLVHQGSSRTQHGHHIAFVEPGPLVFHNSVTEMGGEVVLWLDIPSFVGEIAAAVEAWLAAFAETDPVSQNLARFAHRRATGLPPHVVGIPVIA